MVDVLKNRIAKKLTNISGRSSILRFSEYDLFEYNYFMCFSKQMCANKGQLLWSNKQQKKIM